MGLAECPHLFIAARCSPGWASTMGLRKVDQLAGTVCPPRGLPDPWAGGLCCWALFTPALLTVSAGPASELAGVSCFLEILWKRKALRSQVLRSSWMFDFHPAAVAGSTQVRRGTLVPSVPSALCPGPRVLVLRSPGRVPSRALNGSSVRFGSKAWAAWEVSEALSRVSFPGCPSPGVLPGPGAGRGG